MGRPAGLGGPRVHRRDHVAWRGNAGAALATLISSKVNQWTLGRLILSTVYAVIAFAWHWRHIGPALKAPFARLEEEEPAAR